MLTQRRTYKFGDRVLNTARPEWGPGTVTRAENVAHNGHTAQRLNVRFAAVGIKTLHTGAVELIPADEEHAAASVAERSGWIAELEGNKPADVMVRLPAEASDPFKTLWQRLQYTLNLYRFSREARALTEWAVAQSGLPDPLTRFSRHELETFFDRWARHRDTHLIELVREASRTDPRQVEQMLAQAQPEVRQILRRPHARR